jgi:hypothetical protein
MPEPVPPPVQGRPNELTRFTARMHALTSTAAVPGISVAVSSADRLLYARGFGLADRDAGRPATTRTSWPGPTSGNRTRSTAPSNTSGRRAAPVRPCERCCPPGSWVVGPGA